LLPGILVLLLSLEDFAFNADTHLVKLTLVELAIGIQIKLTAKRLLQTRKVNLGLIYFLGKKFLRCRKVLNG
jgi:hypothetical protein